MLQSPVVQGRTTQGTIDIARHVARKPIMARPDRDVGLLPLARELFDYSQVVSS